MPRRPRLHVPGGLYHVVLRGNHREPIFHEPSDRAMLDDLVAESLARFGARAHAYCWMTNHLHLAVQVAEAPLGPFVQRVASRYARRLQRRLPTSGHLFERRYRAVLVDADAHLLRLTRYIHCNPLRAGMVCDPADYPWSGHRAYLGLATVPWLTTDFTLRLLGADLGSARRAYARLVALGSDADDSARFNRGAPGDARVLGPDPFLRSLATRSAGAARPMADAPAVDLEQIVTAVAAECGVSVEALASPARSRALSAARCLVADRALAVGAASLGAIARRLNRSHSSMSEALARARCRWSDRSGSESGSGG